MAHILKKTNHSDVSSDDEPFVDVVKIKPKASGRTRNKGALHSQRGEWHFSHDDVYSSDEDEWSSDSD